MSRLLKAVLCFKGSPRILHCDQSNLSLSWIFMGTYNCSSWSADQSPVGSKSTSAKHNVENKALHNVNRDTREQEVMIKMRSRMRVLHDLDRENHTHDTLPQYQNQSTDDSTEYDARTKSFTVEPNDVVSSNIDATDEEGLARTQSDFIKRLKEGSVSKKKMDKFISAPFGLVRVDSMNSLHGRPKILKKPGETVGAIDNASKSGVKFGQSIPQHDQSEIKHSRRGLKLNESLSNHDPSEFNTEIESRQGQSAVRHSRSELKRMSESHPDLAIGPLHNKTQQISSSNGTASSSVGLLFSQIHSQHVSQNKTLEYPEPNMFDEQYFGGRITDDRNQETLTQTSAQLSENVFEEQYFGESSSSPDRIAPLPEQVFDNYASTEITTHPIEDRQPRSYKSNEPVDSEQNVQIVHFEQTGKSQISGNMVNTRHNTVQQAPRMRTAEVSPKLEKPDHAEDTIFHEAVTKREMKQRAIPIANVENPTTAYDMAMKIRLEKKGRLVTPSTATGTHPRLSKWSGRVDSKGFRILTDQVVDLQHLTEDVVLTILKDSILYEDDNIIAIDKPYGLPSHGGPGVHHSVGKFLGPLASKLDKTGQLTTLHLVHRLDKETTGVMVLAKSQQNAEFLLAMFKKRMVVKRYWAITKGIPNPIEGVIDIPMAEGSVEDRYRMELRPIYRDKASFLRRATDSLSGERRDAITNYKVLSSANGTSLVECQPETGVKHQIRCHLAFGLNTPVLGDHKYSHYSKMAPQRLYPEILRRLGIRQSKVRHLPMHLHAKALVLPEFRDGRNLFLSARLPRHFVQNMKWLKLEPPQ